MNPGETSGTTAPGCRSHYGDTVLLEGRGDSGCNGGCAVVVFDSGGFNVAFEDRGGRRMAVSISGTSQNTRAYHNTKILKTRGKSCRSRLDYCDRPHFLGTTRL
jgi:hypothetical protein